MSRMKLNLFSWIIDHGRTPTKFLPIYRDDDFLYKCGLCVSGVIYTNRIVITDHLFDLLTPTAQIFAMLHEEGHIDNGKSLEIGSIRDEIFADKYAVLNMGKKDVLSSMQELYDLMMKQDGICMSELTTRITTLERR